MVKGHTLILVDLSMKGNGRTEKWMAQESSPGKMVSKGLVISEKANFGTSQNTVKKKTS